MDRSIAWFPYNISALENHIATNHLMQFTLCNCWSFDSNRWCSAWMQLMYIQCMLVCHCVIEDMSLVRE